jgi:hypothetical protein
MERESVRKGAAASLDRFADPPGRMKLPGGGETCRIPSYGSICGEERLHGA